jgi:hypothetical protein
MIKVIRYRDKPASSYSNEDYWATFNALLKQIFPDYKERKDYNGVSFEVIRSESWQPTLKGVSIEAGSYGNKLRRRVMIIKGDMIDDEAIRTKYNEVKIHAEKDTEFQKIARNKYDRVQDAYERFVNELGLTRYDTDVYSESETTVKLSGRVNWLQLQNISAILDRAIQLSIEVSVPYEKAKEVYEILHPVKE